MIDMEYFVAPESIVRKIWGKGDTILFIFAGASAEFALNKAVDWLYYTGRLPADPLGRLFSTVNYAKAIIFADKQTALRTINAITAIHANIEDKRGSYIPDWAYRDVLFMLIDYSIRSFELLERDLSTTEKEDVFMVFYNLGIKMGISGLPNNYTAWQKMRQEHMVNNLVYSHYTFDLICQYRKHLGPFRFLILREAQKLIVPKSVRQKMNLGKVSFLLLFLGLYKFIRDFKFTRFIKSLIMPPLFKNDIMSLDRLHV